MTESPLVYHYAAASARQGFLRWLAPFAGFPREIVTHRALVWNFLRREFLSRFRGSMLGVFWVLIQPLFLFGLYYAVFGLLLGPRLANGQPNPEFAIYLFAGVIAWSAYAEGAGRACGVVVENGNLVKKVAFPCELLPVHVVVLALVVYLVGALVLLAVGIPLGFVHPGAEMLAWPLVLFVHFGFTLGIGLFLATWQVFMRDASQLLGIAHQALMFASSTFITLEQIEDAIPGGGRFVQWLPWYQLLQAHRAVLGVATGDSSLGLWGHLGWAAAWAVVFLFGGYAFFMSRRHKFADLV